ncbi:LysE family translocator [Plastorhodobacter daqingensis]|uniref:LysE family translocator n=1 Tax=Plastorhodobacter daqingensis TaxID=1387281 RepID=A0ABW2UDF0_9RHOB
MPLDPLHGFVFAGLFSPGPNVILLTAAGARFGMARTLPMIAGISLGVGITSGLTGLGIGALLAGLPTLGLLLRIVAAGWILWMAWQLFQSTRAPEGAAPARPMRFHEAMLFQWVNPKVWAVALAAASGYAAGLTPWGEATRLAAAFSGINLFVCLFWAAAGTALTWLLKTPRAWSIFTTFMALMLAISAGMVFL